MMTSLELTGDIYRIQRRPGSRSQLVTNRGEDGLQIIDVHTCDITTIAFSSGVIDSWCLRADGRVAVVFNDDKRHATWVPLGVGSCRSIEFPPWPITQGMPYDWRGDTLWLKDPDTFAFASVDANGALEVHEGTPCCRGIASGGARSIVCDAQMVGVFASNPIERG